MSIWKRGVAAALGLLALAGACALRDDPSGHGAAVRVGSRAELIAPGTGTFSYPGNDEGNVRFSTGSASITRGMPGAFGAWSFTSSFATARTGAGAAAWNGWLYVTGGYTGAANSLADVQAAPINPDGTLAAFVNAGTLPRGRAFHGTVAYNGFLYAVGGADTTSTATAEVAVAPIRPDGSLGAFVNVNPLPQAVSAAAVFAANGFLYVLGGANAAGSSLTATRSARILGDGSLDSWNVGLPLPTANQGMGSAYWNGRVYLVGGAANVAPVSSAVDPVTGALGAWSSETTPNGPGMAGTGLVLIAAGGLLSVPGNAADTSVYSALIGPSGRLSTWGKTGDAGQLRTGGAVAVWNDHAYVVGGSVGGGTISTVSTAQIGVSPRIPWRSLGGLPATRSAAPWVNHQGYVWVVGGATGNSGGSSAQASVFYTPIAGDGSLAGPGWGTSPATLATARSYHAAVAYNGRVYAIGGYTTGGARTATIESCAVFATTGCSLLSATPTTWRAEASLSGGMADLSAVIVGDRLYVLGGDDGASGVFDGSSTVTAFNIDRSTGALSAGPTGLALPQHLRGHAAAADGNWLYVAGGLNAGGSDGIANVSVTRVDPLTGGFGAWTSVAAMPAGRYTATALVQGGVLVVGGGVYSGSNTGLFLAQINQTDGSLGAWQSSPTSFGKRYAPGLIQHGGNILSGGGRDSATGNDLSDVQAATGIWVGAIGTATSFPTAYPPSIGRLDPAVATLNQRVYLAAGYNSSGGGGADYPSAVAMAPVNPDGTLGAWTVQAATVTPRRLAATAIWNGVMYVAGGTTAGKTAAVEYGAIGSTGSIASFTLGTALRTARTNHAMAAWNGRLYVLGGNDTATLAEVGVAAINADGSLPAATWNATTPLTAAREQHAAVAWNGFLYALGGRIGGNPTTSVEVARIAADGSIPGAGQAGTWAATAPLQLTDAGGPSKAFARDGVMYFVDGTAVQTAPIHADGTLGAWQFSGPTYGVRYQEGVAQSGGYLFVLGGNFGGATNDVESMPLYQPAQRATYSRLFDLGAPQTSADSLTLTGSALPGSVAVQVATAGVDGKFSALTGLGGTLGAPLPIGASNVRWVWARFLLDDFGSPLDAASARDLTGLTLAYTSAPAKLAFSSAPATVGGGACANGTIELRDGLDKPVNAPAAFAVTIAPTIATAFYAGAGCTGSSAASIPFPAGVSSAPFSYKTIAAGTGPLTLTASAPNLASAAQTETVAPGLPDHLAFVVQPADVPALQAFANAPSVAVYDGVGNLASAATNTVTVALVGAGTLSGVASVAATAGVATFPGLSVYPPGSGYKLSAQAGLPGGTVFSNAFTATAAAPSALAFTGLNPALGGGNCSGQANVELRDAQSAVTVAQGPVTVSFAFGSSSFGGQVFAGGACAGPPVTQLVIATSASSVPFSFRTTQPALGSLQLSATATGLTLASGTVTVNPGTPSALVISSSQASFQADTCVVGSVQLRDGAGNAPNASGPITVQLSASPLPLTFLSGSCTGGQVTSGVIAAGTGGFGFGFTAAAAGTGSTTISATAGGLAAGQQAEAVTPGGAHHLRFTTQPADVQVGANFAVAPVVGAFDILGNGVPAYNGLVSVALTGGTAGANLAGALQATSIAGSATFSNLFVDKPGTGYALVASAALPGPGATSNPFNVTGVGPVAIAFANAPSTIKAGQCGALVLETRDGSGAPSVAGGAGVPIALAATGAASSGAVFYAGSSCGGSGVSQVTVAGGQTQALVSYKATAVGALVVNASSPLGSASQTEAIGPGDAAKLFFVASPGSSTAGVALSPAPQVAIQDAFGNRVTSDGATQVTVAIQSGPAGAQLSGNRTVTASAGLAAFNGLTLDKAGSYALTASSAPALGTIGGSAPFEVQANVPAKVVITSSAGSAAIGACTQFTAALADAFGNASPPGGPVSVAIAQSGTASATVFTDGACTTAGSAVALPAGSAGAPGSFKADRAGSLQLAGSAPALASGSFTWAIGASGPVPSQIGFSGVAPSIPAGSCAGPIAVVLRDQSGQELVAPGPIAFSLSASGPSGPGAAFFSDGGCTQAAPSSIPLGQSRVALWLKAPAAGHWSISVSANGLSGQPASFDATDAGSAATPHLNGWGCQSGGAGGGIALLGLIGLRGRRRPRRARRGRARAGATIAAALLLALGAPPALRAAPAKAPSATEEAKALFQEGQIEYNLGHHKQALDLFEKAYKKKPVPALLYNIAQCHRMMGDLKAAKATYRSFLANAPDSPMAETAREKLAEVEKALAAQASAQNAPPVALAQPDKPAATEPPPPPARAADRAATPAEVKPAEKAPAAQAKAPPVEPPPRPAPPPAEAARPPPPTAPPARESAQPAPQTPVAPAPKPPPEEKLVAEARPQAPPAPQPQAPRIKPVPEAAAERRPPAGEGHRAVFANLYLGGVSDPKNKEVGLEAGLVLSPSDAFSVVVGAAIAQKVGVRAAAFLRVVDAAPLRLWIGPRLLFTPGLDGGSSIGGGGQLRAELEVAGWLDLVLGAGAEVYKAPSETVVAPLLTAGLQTRF